MLASWRITNDKSVIAALAVDVGNLSDIDSSNTFLTNVFSLSAFRTNILSMVCASGSIL